MTLFINSIAPIVVLCLMTFYLYRSVSKRVTFFIGKKRWVSLLLTVLLVAPAVNIYGIWLIVLLYITMTLIATDLIVWIVRKICRQKQWNIWLRRIHYSGIVVAIVTSVLMIYGRYNMFHVIETDYSVTTTKSIRDEGYKIAFLTDLHYGTSLSADQLREECSKISSQNPDIVILGGDIVDERTTIEQITEVFQILGDIENQYGIYYVYGNHDKNTYGQGNGFTVEQLNSAMKQNEITILEDTSVVVNGEVLLVGRADYSDTDGQRSSPSELLQNVDMGMEIVVIDHQPREYQDVQNEKADMILSGHTHAGQIWPAGMIARLLHFDDKNYGYESKEGFNEIVSSGIAGWGYPIRTEKHSEYVMINLKKQVY